MVEVVVVTGSYTETTFFSDSPKVTAVAGEQIGGPYLVCISGIALTEWSGPLQVAAGNTLIWSNDVTVTGDVTVPAGVTPTIEPGTVNFASKAELLVYGTLVRATGWTVVGYGVSCVDELS